MIKTSALNSRMKTVAFITKPDGSRNILATVPDLTSLVDEDTGQPITTEKVRYGLRVAVIAMPCSSLWTTPQGLAVGGLVAFGYKDVVYSPVDSKCATPFHL